MLNPPCGTRDFGPEEVITREILIDKIKTHYLRYGGQPVEPAGIVSGPDETV